MAFDLTAVLRLRDNFSAPLRRAARGVSSMEKAVESTTKTSEKLYRGLKKATSDASRFGEASSNSFRKANSSASNLVGTVRNIASAIIGAKVAAETFQATIGNAARFEQSTVLIEAMFNDKKAADAYIKMLERIAAESPVLNSQDMFASSKSFISLSKNAKVLEKAWRVVEKLTVMDPMQGVEGAVFAIRELAGGDVQSLVERFELPRSEIKKIKSLPFEKQVVALDKLLAKMNITDEVVEKMGNATLSQWNRFKEQTEVIFREMGMSANSHLGKALAKLNNVLETNSFKDFAKVIDEFLGRAVGKIAEFVDYVVNNREKIASMWDEFVQKLEPVKNGFEWLKNNIAPVTTAVLSLAAGVTTFKIALSGLFLLDNVIKLIKAYREGVLLATLAQRGFNVALLTNPLTWVAVAIAGIVAAGILLWRNWDLIKTKAAELGAWISEKWGQLKENVSNILTSMGTWVSEKFNQIVTWIREKLQQAKDFVVWVFTEFPFVAAEKLGYLVGVVVGWLMRLPGMFYQWFVNAKNTAITIISELPGRIAGFLSSVITNAVTWLSSLAGKFSEWFTKARDNAVNIVQQLPGKIESFIQSIPERVSGAITAVWESFKKLGASIPKAIAEGFQAALGGLGGLARWAVEKVAGGLSTLRELGASFGRGFARGIARGVDGSHATGLYRVPFDGYIAELHKGERVLTAREAKEYDRVMYSAALARPMYVYNTTNNYSESKRSTSSTTKFDFNGMFNGATFVVREETDIDRIARALVREIMEAEGLV